MLQLGRRSFSSVVLVDFEFHAPDGERPQPICAVFLELPSRRTIRLKRDELVTRSSPPFSTGADTLWVAFYASAEWGCFRALGWSLPTSTVDLFAEHRVETNGLALGTGDGLLGALTCRGLSAMETATKDEMRAVAMRGGPFTAAEMDALVDYCEQDVVALERLFDAMKPRLDGERALLRGQYMKEVAAIEWRGVPTDVATLVALREHWSTVRLGLVERLDRGFGVYDGCTFKVTRFERYLETRGIPWPRLESGGLSLEEDTFSEMALSYPEIQPLRELRNVLAKLRLEKLAVGSDGRNRTLLSPFRSITGRNQPSTSRSIFGGAAWLRSLVKPEPGTALAYLDWGQQEFGIGAALSRDENMMAAYLSADPYLAFARQAGAVPDGATAESHPNERALFKTCSLGVLYGIGVARLARNVGRSEFEARALLAAHRKAYRRFWAWIGGAMDVAFLERELRLGLGWRVHVTATTRPPSIQNFPMQGTGSEMLRLACIYAANDGVDIVMPVHDAVLIEAPIADLDGAIFRAHRAMARASRDLLDGFELRTDSTTVVAPDRYRDKRGATMWATVMGLLADIPGVGGVAGSFTGAATGTRQEEKEEK